MKMIKLLIVPTIVLLPCLCLAQLSIEWSKVFGGSQLDILNAIEVNEDQYELVGTTGSTDNFFSDLEGSNVFWIKGNISDGSPENLLSNFDLNTNLAVDMASGFTSTSPVKLLLSGFDGTTATDYINITDLDEPNTTLSWSNTSLTIGRIRLNRMVKGINNQFWIVGESRSGNATVFKWDTLEGLLWQKEFGGSYQDKATSVVALDNGEIVVMAYTGSSDGDVGQNFGNTDTWLFKLNNDGQILWSKVLGTNNLEYTNDLQPTFDDGFVLATQEVFPTETGSEIQGKVIKTDAEGNIIWTYNGADLGALFTYFYTIIPLSDRRFLVAGHQNLLDVAAGVDLLFVLLDADGNFIWKQTFGGSNEDSLQDIVQVDDQCFLVAGSSSSSDGDVPENAGQIDGWLLKLCMDDLSTSTHQIGNPSVDWSVFPSPVKAGQELILERLGVMGAQEEITLEVVNATGLVLSRQKQGANSNKLGYRLPESIPSGSYWIRIKTENSLTVKPVLVVD